MTPDGRVKGDRVLGFRFRNAGAPSDWSWHTKNNFVGLVNTPILARLTVEFDEVSKALRIHADDLLVIDERVDGESARAKIEQEFTDYVLTIDENPLSDHPERQPVVLVGDGTQPLFHDTADGLVTLHSTESLNAVAGSLGETDLDGRRFRSNIIVSGLGEPFGELSWIHKRVLIGNTEFKAIKSVNRCLVTHANPTTGRRDHDVMRTLVSNFTAETPQFAVMLKAVSGDRKIRVGDSLSVID